MRKLVHVCAIASPNKNTNNSFKLIILSVKFGFIGDRMNIAWMHGSWNAYERYCATVAPVHKKSRMFMLSDIKHSTDST